MEPPATNDKDPKFGTATTSKVPFCCIERALLWHIRVMMKQINIKRIEKSGWSADPPKPEELTLFCCTYNAADTESKGSGAVHHLLGQKNRTL